MLFLLFYYEMGTGGGGGGLFLPFSFFKVLGFVMVLGIRLVGGWVHRFVKWYSDRLVYTTFAGVSSRQRVQFFDILASRVMLCDCCQ